MTKSAKIISLLLTVIMVFSVAGAMVISSFAVDAPALALKKVSENDKELVVSIELTKGSFNSMDIVFNMNGVKCKYVDKDHTGIEAGNATLTSGAILTSNPTAAGGKSHISMIAINGMKTGTIATVTLEKDKSGGSFSITVTDCTVTDEEYNNVSVNPTISNNSIAAAGVKTTTTTTTKKTTTTTTTTKKTTTTTKKTTTTTKGTTTTTKAIPTATLPTDTTSVSEITSSSVIDEQSTDLGYDDYSSDYDYYTPDESETQAVDSDELLDDEKDPKTLIIIGAVVLVLIAGAVVAFIFINKKKNAE
ncbi:MAG: hypothetical protein IJZ57_10395 [Clostridia bacterium]|nr:hypothetical protein [Clostridia bacterium]